MEHARELERTKRRINEVNELTLHQTRALLQLADESADAGVRTLKMVHAQGEKLRNVETDLNTIYAEMEDVDETLTKMERNCCLAFLEDTCRSLCLCCCPCFSSYTAKRKAKRKEEMIQNWNPPKAKKNQNPSQTKQMDSRKEKWWQICTKKDKFPEIRETNDPVENEINENVGQISTLVGNMRSQALEMGNELDGQNKQLDRLNVKAEKNNNKIVDANSRAQNLLSK